jgi:hypothetical protein
MGDTTDTTVVKAIAAGALAFGVTAVLAPNIISATYGLPNTGPFRFITRLWGTRTAALGALALTAEPGAQRDRVVLASAIMNGVDALVALTAGRDLTARSRVMAAATSGAFGLAGAAVAAGVLPS